MTLDFATLRKANVERCEAPDGFNSPVNSWSPTDWGCSLAGEVGEACNEVKKLKRETDGGLQLGDCENRIVAIARELADVVCYADLLAARLGIDLGEAVRFKFNEVSARVNSPVRL